VITQGLDAEGAVAQGSPQIALQTGQLVGSGGDMEGIDHYLGRLIRRQSRQ
jgi:hypothetical protein